MAKVNSATSTNPGSGDTESVKAWEQAEKDAKDVGIRWEKPADDKRSADEIMKDTPIDDVSDTKIQTADGGKKTVEEVLKERVGDYEKDADAAYRAAQVLEHIEKFDGDGKRIAGNSIDNGKIDGFTSSDDARNGTEAGRLQDFGKYGFTNLKGKLNDVTSKVDDPEARKKAEDLGIEWERPKGDDRSAKDIIEGDRLLKGLGNQSSVKDMLKEQVGDFEKDADAAYRASQVLDHIEKFDREGKRQVGGDVGDGKINGFSNSGEAYNDKEAGRLQDFGKYGFDSLKGKLDDYKGAGNDKDERKRAEEELGIKWERPEDDKRSAKDIIEGDPLFKQLGDHSGIRDLMKERIGDFDKDADAAYRAEQVLRHVELFDSNGKELSGGDVGNGEINGFSKDREAYNGTEAGRLQDFAKDGFSALKGNLGDVAPIKGKAEDTKSYKDFLKANPDADEGSKQIAKYTAIIEENYDTIREKAGGADHLDAGALKRYAETTNGLSDETKKALAFWSQPGALDKLDTAADPLKFAPDGKFSKSDLSDWMKTQAPKDATSAISFLTEVAGRNVVGGTDTSKLGKDVYEHPEKYSAEEKAAALQELKDAQKLVIQGAEAGMWSTDFGKVAISNRAGVHPDPAEILKDLDDKVSILESDPEVVKYLNENTPKAMSKLLDDNPELKKSLEKNYEDIKSGDALNTIWDKYTKDGKTDQPAALAEFVSSAGQYQAALGIDQADGVKQIQEAVSESKHGGEFKSYYENELATGNRLKELLKDNEFSDAASAFSMEVAVYGTALPADFTEKFDKDLNDNFTSLASEHMADGASFDDVQKVFGREDGTLDEDKVLKLVQEVSKTNPDFFVNQDGTLVKPEEVINSLRGDWDLLRQGTKTLKEVMDIKGSSASVATDKGILHGVSGLLMAGITIARGAGSGQALSEKQMVDITIGSVQTTTLLAEGGSKGYQDYLKGLNGKLKGELGDHIRSLVEEPSKTETDIRDKMSLNDKTAANWKKFEQYAKGAGAFAGIVGGAYSIFDGVKALRNGDKLTAGMNITSGALGIMAGGASAIEAGASLLFPNLAKTALSALGFTAGALGVLSAGVGILAMLPGLIKEGQQQTSQTNFGDLLGEYLPKYEIDGVLNGDLSDVPDDAWPDAGSGMS